MWSNAKKHAFNHNAGWISLREEVSPPFFNSEMMTDKTRTLAELAAMVQGELQGDPGILIHGLADIDSAGDGEIAFLIKPGRGLPEQAIKAAALILPHSATALSPNVIRVKDPGLAAAIIHQYFCRQPFKAEGVSAQAHIGAACNIPAQVSIGPMAVLGTGVILGERVVIKPGVVLGDHVVIGDDSVLHANVTVADHCRIGARVIIHSGTVIGADGFGYATDAQGRHLKRPHVGVVQVDDDVEIGANVCVDRATFGRTWIRRGAKIDNLVQIGHNVTVGEDSIIVAQSGIAGSATLGRGVILGGQAAVNGHISLGDYVKAAARSGIHNNLEAGAVVAGMPAIPHRKWLRGSAILEKLPELVSDIRELKKKVAMLCRPVDGE